MFTRVVMPTLHVACMYIHTSHLLKLVVAKNHVEFEETGPEQEWSNGTEFSGYSDSPEF